MLTENDVRFEEYKKAAPLCETHKPSGGVRGTCLVCACQELSAALSRISYLVDFPNDMAVSKYDLHCDPQEVVREVERKLQSLT